jgi:hypothetical protein
LRSDDFAVVNGANEGDGLGFATDLMLDDIYALRAGAEPRTLSLSLQYGRYVVGEDSALGQAGDTIHLDCAVTLMDDRQHITEMLVLVQVDANGLARATYLLPLAPLSAKTEYTLLSVDTQTARQKLAQVACVSFTQGTQITLASGRQCAVENLKAGDLILTRDNGAQPLRWVGHVTQRATGAFAPIRIAAGTLNNCGDLTVSPDHRLFIYQRRDHLGLGRSEALIRARHLVNGSSVRMIEGGFVDYYQLLFDTHQIIFAEGIAAESMLVDDTTAPMLDEALIASLAPGSAAAPDTRMLDVGKDLLARPDAVDLLRRASRG